MSKFYSGQNPAALLVSPSEGDHAYFNEIFGREQWDLYTAGSLASALAFLRKTAVPVVISEARLPGATWKELLEMLQQMSDPPLMVVISAAADDYLWSEVLNLGGHDVLAKPLHSEEVRRVMGHAWRRRDSGGRKSQQRAARAAGA